MRVTIDNQEFDLNIEEAKKLNLIKPVVSHKMGQRYKATTTKEEYILARCKPNILCLIGLQSGNRWEDPMNVKNCNDISQEEFDKITGGESFELIS